MNKKYLSEFIGTFFLVFIGTGAIMINKIDSNALGHLGVSFAFGLTVFIGSLVAGPISGGSFNPARSIGPAIISGNYAEVWIYVIAPIVGAIIGGITYNFNCAVKVDTQFLQDRDNKISYSE